MVQPGWTPFPSFDAPARAFAVGKLLPDSVFVLAPSRNNVEREVTPAGRVLSGEYVGLECGYTLCEPVPALHRQTGSHPFSLTAWHAWSFGNPDRVPSFPGFPNDLGKVTPEQRSGGCIVVVHGLGLLTSDRCYEFALQNFARTNTTASTSSMYKYLFLHHR